MSIPSGSSQYGFEVKETKEMEKVKEKKKENYLIYKFKINRYFVYVYYRKIFSSKKARNCSMDSLFIVVNHPIIPFSRMVRLLGEKYFRISNRKFDSIEKEESLEFIEEKEKLLNSFLIKAMTQIHSWPILHPQRKYQDLPFLNHKISYITPSFPKIKQISNTKKNKSEVKKPVVEKCQNYRNIYERELDQFSVFITPSSLFIQNLVYFWKLVMTGQNILIVSQSVEKVSKIVECIVSLVNPIGVIYSKDKIFPYFSVNHSKYVKISSIKDVPKKSTNKDGGYILGSTNYYLLKKIKFGNVFCFDKDVFKGEKNKNKNKIFHERFNTKGESIEVGKKRKKLIFNFEECIIFENADNKTLLSELDFGFKKNCLNKISGSNLRSSEKSKIIQSWFKKLTLSFLHPLNCCLLEYVKKYVGKGVLLKKDLVRYVKKPNLFYDFVSNPDNIKHFSKTKNYVFENISRIGEKKKILSLYKSFCEGNTFNVWIDERIDVVHINALRKLNLKKLISQLKDIAILDLFLSILQEIKLVNGSMGKLLESVAKSMINLSPKNIRQPMKNELMKL